MEPSSRGRQLYVRWWCIAITLMSVSQAAAAAGRMLFATKTPYELSRQLFGRFVEETLRLPVAAADGRDLYPAEVCAPAQLSLLLRHGSRFPSPGDVRDVAAFVARLRDTEVSDAFAHLKRWSNPFTMEVSKTLGRAGFDENVDIARRTVANFAPLFAKLAAEGDGERTGPPDVSLVASDTERTRESARGFASGLADALSVRDRFSERLKLDNATLRFFDVCRKYLETVEDNKAAVADFYAFRHGPEMRAAAGRVSRRLGLAADHSLTADELRTIWVMCGYETSLFRNKQSDWCDLLTPEETEVLEYTWDLKSYWKKAHGHEVNYAQSCPLIDRMMANLEAVVAGNRDVPKLAAYFGHAETVLPVLAALGLFNDSEPLRATNFEQHRMGRAFRSSYIASFASNVAFALYRCQSPGGGAATRTRWGERLEEYMVQLLVNEHAVPFPFAAGRLAVPFGEVRAYYAHRIGSECRFSDICSLADPGVPAPSIAGVPGQHVEL